LDGAADCDREQLEKIATNVNNIQAPDWGRRLMIPESAAAGHSTQRL